MNVGGRPREAYAGHGKVGEPINDGAERREAMECALRGDAAFKLAMLRARSGKLEHFALGVIEEPGTEYPVYIPHRGLPRSNCRSPAALCAEMGTSDTEQFIASR